MHTVMLIPLSRPHQGEDTRSLKPEMTMRPNTLQLAAFISIATHMAIGMITNFNYNHRSPAAARLNVSWKTTVAAQTPVPSPLPKLGAKSEPTAKAPPPDRLEPEPSHAPTTETQELITIDLGLMPYFSTSDLDVKPQVIIDFPENPRDLNGFFWKGGLVVTLWISSTGTMDYVQIAPSTAPSAFEKRVMAHLYRMTFSPGKMGDTAVPSTMRIHMNFASLEDEHE